MDLRQIKNLMKEFEDSKIHTLEIKDNDFSIRLEKANNTIFSSTPSAPLVASTPVQAVEAEEKQPVVVEDDLVEVSAPLVGTYYQSPSPESDPFVTVGKHVNKGDVVCIIEAMKVMNEITAPVSGTVERILVKDATMVEFGQVVMEIKE